MDTRCRLGSHIRRMNPRDTAQNMNRRRMIRRGATYGPHLPEDAPEDGVERGIAAFVICASLIRQFEFAQNVWVNDRNFSRTRQRTRPNHRQPRRHVRIQNPQAPDTKKDHRLTGIYDREGRRLLLPSRHHGPSTSFGARPSLAANARGNDHEHIASSPHLQSGSRSPQIHAGQTPHEHLLDVELPVGSAARSCCDGKSILDDDRSPPCAVAELRDAGMQRRAVSPGDRWYAGAISTVQRSASRDCRAK